MDLKKKILGLGLLFGANDWVLTVLLTAIAVTGPLVAYAGVTLVYPQSIINGNLDTDPPITFAAGSDYAAARTLGLVYDLDNVLNTTDNLANFTINLGALSGGNFTIEKLVNISVKAANVSSFKLELLDTFNDVNFNPDYARMCVWRATSAPVDCEVNTNAPSTKCIVLNLETGGESSGSCTIANNRDTGDGGIVGYDVMLELALPSATTGTGSLTIRATGFT